MVITSISAFDVPTLTLVLLAAAITITPLWICRPSRTLRRKCLSSFDINILSEKARKVLLTAACRQESTIFSAVPGEGLSLKMGSTRFVVHLDPRVVSEWTKVLSELADNGLILMLENRSAFTVTSRGFASAKAALQKELYQPDLSITP